MHTQIFSGVQGVIMESKSGRRALLADRVVDCTGDADVAHLAGAEYRCSTVQYSTVQYRFSTGANIKVLKQFRITQYAFL